MERGTVGESILLLNRCDLLIRLLCTVPRVGEDGVSACGIEVSGEVVQFGTVGTE